jgi:hypothetical protein
VSKKNLEENAEKSQKVKQSLSGNFSPEMRNVQSGLSKLISKWLSITEFKDCNGLGPL